VRAVVSAFDAHVGLGQVRTDDGAEVLFHCAEIADGSRSIDVGTAVTCEIREKFGRPEAFAISPA
jgi:cold shock CspA family protein